MQCIHLLLVIFGFMHKFLYNIVMGIINKTTSQNNKTQVLDINQLNKQELEFLLNTLKQTMIMGEHVEMFYNLVIKLQNQYLEQTK